MVYTYSIGQVLILCTSFVLCNLQDEICDVPIFARIRRRLLKTSRYSLHSSRFPAPSCGRWTGSERKQKALFENKQIQQKRYEYKDLNR
jgi:hypothetical protein